MITIVRVEARHDRIDQMLASASGHDTIVVIRAPHPSTIAERSTPAGMNAPFPRAADEEEEITWEDAEWQ